ncbi:hypothetical protein DdX_19735 [Ditylenchus destructor]|uniref:Uncharacterized protein n=1 Tax=Ditylenchus destructor TaxID=166010 RepID=A0AAD4MHA0_9BILA|nr:hypothetical protein DdX_19735 [Ditylenchus destructor]
MKRFMYHTPGSELRRVICDLAKSRIFRISGSHKSRQRQSLSARPVPIDSAGRDEAIHVSHARIRAATRNLPFYVTHALICIKNNVVKKKGSDEAFYDMNWLCGTSTGGIIVLALGKGSRGGQNPIEKVLESVLLTNSLFLSLSFEGAHQLWVFLSSVGFDTPHPRIDSILACGSGFPVWLNDAATILLAVSVSLCPLHFANYSYHCQQRVRELKKNTRARIPTVTHIMTRESLDTECHQFDLAYNGWR